MDIELTYDNDRERMLIPALKARFIEIQLAGEPDL